MVRHISVFSFQDTPKRQKNLEEVKAYLDTIPSLYPAAKRQRIYLSAAPAPRLSEDAPVLFGDMIQVIDFETPEDAAGYPTSAAHTRLAEFSTPMLKKVTAMDYVVADKPAEQ